MESSYILWTLNVTIATQFEYIKLMACKENASLIFTHADDRRAEGIDGDGGWRKDILGKTIPLITET